MNYRPLRRDLTETTRKCDFCPNILGSLRVYILEEVGAGRIAYAGPICAGNHIGPEYSLRGLSDLTRSTLADSDARGNGGGGKNFATARGRDDGRRRRAVEYLILREEKLVEKIGSYHVFQEYYITWRSENLTEKAVDHVINIEHRAPDPLKLNRLQEQYNYLFWLDVAIERLPEDKQGFLQDIRSSVARGDELTPKQRMAANKWLKKIRGVPQLA